MIDQDMGKILIKHHSLFIGISQYALRHCAPNTHMIEIILHAKQAGRGVTKALAIGKLSEEQAEILIKKEKD
jgi:hypothetical protein